MDTSALFEKVSVEETLASEDAFVALLPPIDRNTLPSPPPVVPYDVSKDEPAW